MTSAADDLNAIANSANSDNATKAASAGRLSGLLGANGYGGLWNTVSDAYGTGAASNIGSVTNTFPFGQVTSPSGLGGFAVNAAGEAAPVAASEGSFLGGLGAAASSYPAAFSAMGVLPKAGLIGAGGLIANKLADKFIPGSGNINNASDTSHAWGAAGHDALVGAITGAGAGAATGNPLAIVGGAIAGALIDPFVHWISDKKTPVDSITTALKTGSASDFLSTQMANAGITDPSITAQVLSQFNLATSLADPTDKASMKAAIVNFQPTLQKALAYQSVLNDQKAQTAQFSQNAMAVQGLVGSQMSRYSDNYRNTATMYGQQMQKIADMVRPFNPTQAALADQMGASGAYYGNQQANINDQAVAQYPQLALQMYQNSLNANTPANQVDAKTLAAAQTALANG